MKTNLAKIIGLIFLSTTVMRAVTISLADVGLNLDGTVSNLSAPQVNSAAFDTSRGIGTVTLTLAGGGPHFVGLFVDHDIDAATNTKFNEYGTASGVPLAGQSWEIDEPGHVFGDISTHFGLSSPSGSALDNVAAITSAAPNDVSMALGWNFLLTSGESAAIAFSIVDTAAPTGFYLQHTDPASGASIFFSSSLAIVPGPGPVPDNAAMLPLLGIALFVLGSLRCLIDERWRRIPACR